MANKFNIGLQSFDSLIGEEQAVTNIPIDKLHSFKNHPFKVVDDDKMQELVSSIRENGILNPAIVRHSATGGYELISGHRRTYACKQAGINEMPCIVKNLSDDEATIIMVDSNIQRAEILPSEKAFAYKMRLEAIKRKAGRPKNSAQVEQNLKGKTSVEIVADEVGESRANIQRFIRLTNLNKPLLDCVDEKLIPLNVAVELSYLPGYQQHMLSNVINEIDIYPSLAQAKKLRKYSDGGKLDAAVIDVILSETADKPVSIKIDKEVKSLLPTSYSKKDVQGLVLRLLKEYFEKGGE